MDIELAPMAQETIWFKQQCFEDAEAWCQKVNAGTVDVSSVRLARPNHFIAVQIADPQVKYRYNFSFLFSFRFWNTPQSLSVSIIQVNLCHKTRTRLNPSFFSF